MRLSLCLLVLSLTASAAAQPLQPIYAAPAQPLPQRELREEPPPPRALFHFGAGFGILTQRSTSTGYRQLEDIGYSLPGISLHLNGGAQLVATDWLRLGAELAYEFAGDTTERRFRGTTREETVRFHMGIVDLSLTPYIRVGRGQLGLRLAGGFGFSRWAQNSLGSTSGIYRASAALDLYFPLARSSTGGINLRVGYQLRRTLETGPIDLVFDQSSFVLNFAFMFGAGS